MYLNMDNDKVYTLDEALKLSPDTKIEVSVSVLKDLVDRADRLTKQVEYLKLNIELIQKPKNILRLEA